MDMSQSRRKEGIKTMVENRPKKSHFTTLPEKLNIITKSPKMSKLNFEI